MIRNASILTVLLQAALFFHTSAQLSVDSAFTVRPDSLTAARLKKMDSIRSATEAGFLEFRRSYDSVFSAANATEQKLQARIDSLARLDLPAPELAQQLDSIRQEKRSVLSDLKRKWEATRTKHTGAIRELNLPPPWDGPQQELLAAVEKLDLQIPDADFRLPSFSSGVAPRIDLPGVESPIGSVDLSDPQLPGMPEELGQVQPYTDQVNAIREGKVDETIDRQLSRVESINGLQEQREGFEMPEMSADKAKQEYLTLARSSAKAHFAGKYDQVDNALKDLSKLKKKYSSLQSMKDMPKRRPNEMRGKPLRERLRPEVSLQLMQRKVWMLDANPSLGYRLTSRLTVGAGWNQRWAYNSDRRRYAHDERLYGPRAYGGYEWKHGIALRAEADHVNALVHTRFNEPIGREWLWNILAGLRKDYAVGRGIKGYLLLMYNLYDPDSRRPYPRFNLRIGFGFSLKKGGKAMPAPATACDCP